MAAPSTSYISRIRLRENATYKNLDHRFEWKDIPKFAVITGISGVGKTALLEAIRDGVQEQYIESSSIKYDIDVISDPLPNLYLVINNKSLGDHPNRGKNDRLLPNRNTTGKQFSHYVFKKLFYPDYKISEKILQKGFDEALSSFKRKYPENDNENENLDLKLEKHWETFLGLHMSGFGTVEANLERIVDSTDTANRLNDFLEEQSIAYRVIWSEEGRYIIVKNAIAANTVAAAIVAAETVGDETVAAAQQIIKNKIELSPGEKVQLVMLLWQFDKEELAIACKNKNTVMLLDEPDANMHPTIVWELITKYQTEFVAKHNVQIIMTTHNPTTLCGVLNKENIFLMTKQANGCPIIKRVHSKQDAIRQLIPTIISVYDRVRFVFVEGNADIKFYQIAYKEYVKRFNTLNPKSPIPDYNIEFCTPGHDEESNCDKVVAAVKRLVGNDPDSSLFDCVYGIIDGDNKSTKIEVRNVSRLTRYSVENYIYDPVHLFYVWDKLHEKREIHLKEKVYEKIAELKGLKTASLQNIANSITTLVLDALNEGLKPWLKEISIKKISENVIEFGKSRVSDIVNTYDYKKMDSSFLDNVLKDLFDDAYLYPKLQRITSLSASESEEMIEKISTDFTDDLIKKATDALEKQNFADKKEVINTIKPTAIKIAEILTKMLLTEKFQSKINDSEVYSSFAKIKGNIMEPAKSCFENALSSIEMHEKIPEIVLNAQKEWLNDKLPVKVSQLGDCDAMMLRKKLNEAATDFKNEVIMKATVALKDKRAAEPSRKEKKFIKTVAEKVETKLKIILTNECGSKIKKPEANTYLNKMKQNVVEFLKFFSEDKNVVYQNLAPMMLDIYHACLCTQLEEIKNIIIKNKTTLKALDNIVSSFKNEVKAKIKQFVEENSKSENFSGPIAVSYSISLTTRIVAAQLKAILMREFSSKNKLAATECIEKISKDVMELATFCINCKAEAQFAHKFGDCLNEQELQELVTTMKCATKLEEIVETVNDFREKLKQEALVKCTGVERTQNESNLISTVTNIVAALLMAFLTTKKAKFVEEDETWIEALESLQEANTKFKESESHNFVVYDDVATDDSLNYPMFWSKARGHSLEYFLFKYGEFVVQYSNDLNTDTKFTNRVIEVLEESPELIMLPIELCEIFKKIHGRPVDLTLLVSSHDSTAA